METEIFNKMKIYDFGSLILPSIGENQSVNFSDSCDCDCNCDSCDNGSDCDSCQCDCNNS